MTIYFLVFLALNSELVNIMGRSNTNDSHLLYCKLQKIVRNALKASNDPPVDEPYKHIFKHTFLMADELRDRKTLKILKM